MLKLHTFKNIYLLILLPTYIYLFFFSYINIYLKTNNYDIAYIVLNEVFYSILFLPLIYLIFYCFKNKYINIFIVIIIFSILIALYNKIEISYIVKSFRDTISWILVFMIILHMTIIQNIKFIIYLYVLSIILIMLNGFYSLYIQFIFNNDHSIIYFYDLYSQLDSYKEYNVVRNGMIRAFGFFGSNITYSTVLIIPLSFLFVSFWKYKNPLILYIFCIVLYYLWMTQTRNPFLAFFFSIFIYIFLFHRKNFINKIWVFNILYFLATITLIYFLANMNYLEPSSAGRAPQIDIVLSTLISSPFGMGLGYNNLEKLDLSFGSIIIQFGLIGFILYYLFFYFISKTMYIEYHISKNHYERLIYATNFILINTLMLLTNFSNIFGFELYIYSIILGTTFSYIKYSKSIHRNESLEHV